MKRPHTNKPLPHDEIIAMRMDGCTYQQIGDRFGVTRERIRQILCQAEKSLTGYIIGKMKKSAVADNVVTMRMDGSTMAEISKSNKINIDAVRDIISEKSPDLLGFQTWRPDETVCQNCGEMIVKKSKPRKYCSRECFYAAHKGRKSKIPVRTIVEAIQTISDKHTMPMVAFSMGVDYVALRYKIRKLLQDNNIDTEWMSVRRGSPNESVVAAVKRIAH